MTARTTPTTTTSLEHEVDLKTTPPLYSCSSMTPPQTPTATATTAHKVYAEIQTIYNALVTLTSLAPGPEINGLLTRLVDLCVQPYGVDVSDEILRLCSSKNLCELLRPVCGTAEGFLESYWAQRMILETKKVGFTHTTTTPSKTTSSTAIAPLPHLLTTFPYHKNYTDLTHLEVSSLTPFLSSAPRNIAFIGSGPLPLTSICILSHYPSAQIHNIDRDVDALQTSEELCASMGFAAQMRFASDDVSVGAVGAQSIHWKEFDVVFLAALVGMDSSSKIDILSGLGRKLSPGTIVVARSARGVRGVLYPVLELGEELQSAGYEILAEIHPWTDVVNSVVVLRVKERFDFKL